MKLNITLMKSIKPVNIVVAMIEDSGNQYHFDSEREYHPIHLSNLTGFDRLYGEYRV